MGIVSKRPVYLKSNKYTYDWVKLLALASISGNDNEDWDNWLKLDAKVTKSNILESMGVYLLLICPFRLIDHSDAVVDSIP